MLVLIGALKRLRPSQAQARAKAPPPSGSLCHRQQRLDAPVTGPTASKIMIDGRDSPSGRRLVLQPIRTTAICFCFRRSPDALSASYAQRY